MALSAGVQRPECTGRIRSAPQLDNTTVFQGGAVMLDTSGRAATPASFAAGAYCAGVAVPRDNDLDRYDNTVTGHADGFVTVRFQEGVFGFLNDGTNPILSTTQPGTIIFAKDDQTASLSSNGGARPVLGRLVKLDSGVLGGPVVVEMSEHIGRSATDNPGSLVMLTSVGHNLAGAATLTGAVVGDKVIGVSDVTDSLTKTSSFESFITVADQIQQTAAADLSAKTIVVLLQRH
jgi:hypothetical protein